MISDKDRSYITLDDAGTLNAANQDPTGFIGVIKHAVIDEVQRAPDLMLAIKASVGEDEEPGRFLLTGSANLATVKDIADSLAGGMAVIPLLPSYRPESGQAWAV